MIQHKFDVAIKDATGKVQWAQEAFDSADDALAYGLEWTALRIREGQPITRKIIVSHLKIDDDYGNPVEVDVHYMEVKLKTEVTGLKG